MTSQTWDRVSRDLNQQLTTAEREFWRGMVTSMSWVRSFAEELHDAADTALSGVQGFASRALESRQRDASRFRRDEDGPSGASSANQQAA